MMKRHLLGFSITGVLDVVSRTNSPRACWVKGQMFKRDLTPPHTDWPTPTPETVFTLSYDSRPLLEQTVLWVSGWLLSSTEFTVCDLCYFRQAMLTFLQSYRHWNLSNTDIPVLGTESRWRSTGPWHIFKASAAYLNIISAVQSW